MILNDPVDTWPVVDALISFFSNGFPLQKAIEYKNLRRPFVVNDLEAQYILFDRYVVFVCISEPKNKSSQGGMAVQICIHNQCF